MYKFSFKSRMRIANTNRT